MIDGFTTCQIWLGFKTSIECVLSIWVISIFSLFRWLEPIRIGDFIQPNKEVMSCLIFVQSNYWYGTWILFIDGFDLGTIGTAVQNLNGWKLFISLYSYVRTALYHFALLFVRYTSILTRNQCVTPFHGHLRPYYPLVPLFYWYHWQVSTS